jgi:hypothetical protein
MEGKKTLVMASDFVVGQTFDWGEGKKTLNIASAFVVGQTRDWGRERRQT